MFADFASDYTTEKDGVWTGQLILVRLQHGAQSRFYLCIMTSHTHGGERGINLRCHHERFGPKLRIEKFRPKLCIVRGQVCLNMIISCLGRHVPTERWIWTTLRNDPDPSLEVSYKHQYGQDSSKERMGQYLTLRGVGGVPKHMLRRRETKASTWAEAALCRKI